MSVVRDVIPLLPLPRFLRKQGSLRSTIHTQIDPIVIWEHYTTYACLFKAWAGPTNQSAFRRPNHPNLFALQANTSFSSVRFYKLERRARSLLSLNGNVHTSLLFPSTRFSSSHCVIRLDIVTTSVEVGHCGGGQQRLIVAKFCDSYYTNIVTLFLVKIWCKLFYS